MPGLCLLISSLARFAARTHVESPDKPFNALPGKHDIKRHSFMYTCMTNSYFISDQWLAYLQHCAFIYFSIYEHANWNQIKFATIEQNSQKPSLFARTTDEQGSRFICADLYHRLKTQI